MSSNGSKSNSPYRGDLQIRLRTLSTRTNCLTRQENGQRYLGPPLNWTGNPPQNSEVFISKLPADCFEDEIYDFCSQAGDIYLIRLMINFENENRGFCFVTFGCPQQAAEAVAFLPQKPLRKGHFVHAEISLNNCSLKMYNLDYRFDDVTLENEIRMNTKDVVNVTIKRNTVQHTLMATLYFETHQKAAIARRKLSQVANSRWGQNVKVFLWSKKMQNKQSNQKDHGDLKNKENDKFLNTSNENLFTRRILPDFDVNIRENEKNNVEILKELSITNSDFYSWKTYSPKKDFCYVYQKEDSDYSFSSPGGSFDSNSCSTTGTYSTIDSFDNSSLSPTLSHDQFSPCKNYYGETFEQEHSLFLSPVSNDRPSFVSDAGSTLPDTDPLFPERNIDSQNRSVYDLLDFSSPFDFSPQKKVNSVIGSSPTQIELILNEASQALRNLCVGDNA